MAEGGGYSEEAIISYLVAKFSVDPQAAKQALQDTQEYLNRQRETTKAEADLASLDYNASLEIQKEQQKQYFDTMKGLIEKHWNERLEIVKKGSAEELDIQKKLQQDLEMLNAARDRTTTAQDKKEDETHEKHQKRAFDLLKLGREHEGLLTALGIGKLEMANIASKVMGFTPQIALATYASHEYQQFAESRRDRLSAMSLARGAGMESEYGYDLTGYLTEIPKVLGYKKETVAQTMAQLLPMAPSAGGVGGEQFGELTKNALLLGSASGTSPTDVAKIMTQYRMLDQIPVEKLADKFNDVINAAKMADVSTQTFAGWLTTLVEQGKGYNVSVDESKNLLIMFSRELREGILTTQQLAQVQSAAATAPEGFRALLGQRVLAQGGELADYIRSRGGDKSASALAGLIGTISEGRVMDLAGNVTTPAPESPEGQVAAARKQELNKLIAKDIIDSATTMSAGKGPADYARDLQYFAARWNIIGNYEAVQKSVAYLAGGGVAPEPTPEQKAEFKTTEENLKKGTEEQRENVHWLKKSSEGLRLVFESSHILAAWFYEMTGDKEKAVAARKAYGSAVDVAQSVDPDIIPKLMPSRGDDPILNSIMRLIKGKKGYEDWLGEGKATGDSSGETVVNVKVVNNGPNVAITPEKLQDNVKVKSK